MFFYTGHLGICTLRQATWIYVLLGRPPWYMYFYTGHQCIYAPRQATWIYILLGRPPWYIYFYTGHQGICAPRQVTWIYVLLDRPPGYIYFLAVTQTTANQVLKVNFIFVSSFSPIFKQQWICHLPTNLQFLNLNHCRISIILCTCLLFTQLQFVLWLLL